MVQSLRSQLAHALIKRPEVYSMEDTTEQLMTRLRSKKDQMIAIEGGHRQDAILEMARFREATQEERRTIQLKDVR